MRFISSEVFFLKNRNLNVTLEVKDVYHLINPLLSLRVGLIFMKNKVGSLWDREIWEMRWIKESNVQHNVGWPMAKSKFQEAINGDTKTHKKSLKLIRQKALFLQKVTAYMPSSDIFSDFGPNGPIFLLQANHSLIIYVPSISSSKETELLTMISNHGPHPLWTNVLFFSYYQQIFSHIRCLHQSKWKYVVLINYRWIIKVVDKNMYYVLIGLA